MATAIGRAEFQSLAEMNLTPLIDIMLVLLIIFIITIPIQTHAIKIDNPAPNTDPPIAARPVVSLSIDYDGTLLWNEQPVDKAALRGLISEYAARDPQPEIHEAPRKARPSGAGCVGPRSRGAC